jgi:hypothetical protein
MRRHAQTQADTLALKYMLNDINILYETDNARVQQFNPLKPKFVYMLFKNSVRTSKRTPNFTITKINWLMVFKEIIAV